MYYMETISGEDFIKKLTQKDITSEQINGYKIEKIEKLLIKTNELNSIFMFFNFCDFSDVDQVSIITNQMDDSKELFISFKNCFFNRLNFYGCKIKNLRLIETDANKIILSNSFLCSLESSRLKLNRLQILNTEIEEHLEFDKLNVDNVSVIESEIKRLIVKKSSIIKKFDLSSNNIGQFKFYETDLSEKCEVSFFDNFINNDFYLNSLKINNLTLYNNRFYSSIIIESIDIQSFMIKNNILDKNFIFSDNKIKEDCDTDTYKVLKYFSQKNSDNQKYLNYNKLEQNSYLSDKQLSIDDRIIIYFKKYVSDFGTNWFRALIITLLFSLIIIYIPVFYILNKNYDIFTNTFWNGYLRLLNITDYSNPFISDRKIPIDNGIANAIYFIGKIFIGIGIYEIIISFRKYNK